MSATPSEEANITISRHLDSLSSVKTTPTVVYVQEASHLMFATTLSQAPLAPPAMRSPSSAQQASSETEKSSTPAWTSFAYRLRSAEPLVLIATLATPRDLARETREGRLSGVPPQRVGSPPERRRFRNPSKLHRPITSCALSTGKSYPPT